MNNSYDIENLIPQREPIKMIDSLIDANNVMAITTLFINSNNYFVNTEGIMAEAGLIEHIAQSASAQAGYLAISNGKDKAPVGYIAEIRDFHCYRCPHAGEKLETTISVDDTIGNITCISGKTIIGKELIAETKMRIYINEDS